MSKFKLNLTGVLSLLLFLNHFIGNSFADESDTYNFTWLDQDKEVYVLQNRKYRKKGKVHVNLGGGLNISGAFVDGTTIQGRVGYFFKESWGFEGIYAKNAEEENATADSVRNRSSSGSVPFRRLTQNYMGAMFLWSPFYSKINTFNKIIYFDWIFGLGYGEIETTNNKNEFLYGSNVDTAEKHGALLWDVGFKFYLSESWDLRLDMTVLHFKPDIVSRNSTTAGTEWTSHWDLAIGFGINF